MKSINQKNVKIKNLIGIIDNPTHEDLLFEIVSFLDNERRYEGTSAEFKTHEAFLKTRVRISSLLSEDLDELVKLGYLEKLKYSSYKVIKHLWEK
jgi:hypothetical protein